MRLQMGAGVAKVKHALLTQGILRCQQLGGGGGSDSPPPSYK